MVQVELPILTLALRKQRYSCHGCGNCCRDFTVQLREEDLAKLKAQNWEEKLGHPVTIDFRGVRYLRQREDGACVFLMENGLCRIHKEFGFSDKPIACQLFPFHLLPTARGIGMGINFACQSVLENKGMELPTHVPELERMVRRGGLTEVNVAAPPPMLTDRLRASTPEEQSLIDRVDRWLRRTDVGLPPRLDGLAWVARSLAQARLENVREKRFSDLLDVLFSALPAELEHHPITPPTARQKRMLRQGVFARIEDPKLNAIERQGRLRLIIGQLSRSRRFKSGRGLAPPIGAEWPRIELANVEAMAYTTSAQDAELIDDLLTRYTRACVLGRRYWGASYYGWNMIGGLQALLFNVACVGWLSRLHAAGRADTTSGPIPIDIVDVRAALGRVDRTAGRAKWLGSTGERLRLGYLNMDDGLRRLLQRYWRAD